MNLKPLLICLTIACAPGWASAAPSYLQYGAYQKAKEEPLARGYMSGLVRGVMMANDMIKSSTGKPLFCLPPNLGVNREFGNDLIDAVAELAAPENRSKLPVDALLMKGMKDMFPCP